MEFYQLTQLLFGNHLLANDKTVAQVLNQYELAISHGEHSVGLVKRPTENYKSQAKVFRKGESKIGLIPIKGSLTYEETGWEGLCGMTSYENIQGQAEYLIKEEKVKEIILELNSGGGQAYGCFETAQAVKELAKENNVKITSYVDGVAYSGGYAWASIADELIVNPLGRVGSIGVVLPLINTSERDKKEGIKRIYVTSGKSKVPYDAEGNYTKEFLEDAEKNSKLIYDEFVSHVAENRGIDKESVINTEAKTFSAKDALSLNLIDSIMTKAQFYQHINSMYGENIMTLQMKGSEEIKTEGQGEKVQTNSDLITSLSEQVNTLTSDKEGLTTQVSDLTEQVSDLTESLKVKDTELETLRQKVAELESNAAKVEYENRKAKIAALVAVDEVEGVMSIAADLPEDKFSIYVKTLESKQEKSRVEMEELGSKGDDNSALLNASEAIVARIKEKQTKG